MCACRAAPHDGRGLNDAQFNAGFCESTVSTLRYHTTHVPNFLAPLHDSNAGPHWRKNSTLKISTAAITLCVMATGHWRAEFPSTKQQGLDRPTTVVYTLITVVLAQTVDGEMEVCKQYGRTLRSAICCSPARAVVSFRRPACVIWYTDGPHCDGTAIEFQRCSLLSTLVLFSVCASKSQLNLDPCLHLAMCTGIHEGGRVCW